MKKIKKVQKYLMIVSCIFVLLSIFSFFAQGLIYDYMYDDNHLVDDYYEVPDPYDNKLMIIEEIMFTLPFISVFLVILTAMLYLFTIQNDLNKLLNKKI